jgi:hypothetical protein
VSVTDPDVETVVAEDAAVGCSVALRDEKDEREARCTASAYEDMVLVVGDCPTDNPDAVVLAESSNVVTRELEVVRRRLLAPEDARNSPSTEERMLWIASSKSLADDPEDTSDTMVDDSDVRTETPSEIAVLSSSVGEAEMDAAAAADCDTVDVSAVDASKEPRRSCSACFRSDFFVATSIPLPADWMADATEITSWRWLLLSPAFSSVALRDENSDEIWPAEGWDTVMLPESCE